MTSFIASIPIITCAGKNKTRKVAIEITTKGYCSTKNMYYFEIKLLTVPFHRKGTIPFPEMIILSLAEENDLTVLEREAVHKLIYRNVFVDKIYSDFIITQREKACRELFSTAISNVRPPPIESFLNRLNEKTNIQRAMKARSTSGLLVHTMSKIAIAFIYLIFKNNESEFNY